MKERKPFLHRLGFFLFALGITLGMLVILAKAWPRLEASMYGFSRYGYPPLKFSCPTLMTIQDRSLVKLRIENPLNLKINWYVNTQLSSFVAMITQEQVIELQPGETRVLTWEVGQENIDLKSFIFAHVFASPSAGLKMGESLCGTLVLNLPFKGGNFIYYAGLILAILSAALSLWLWPRYAQKEDSTVQSHTWWMRFTIAMVSVGVVASILSWWFLAVLILILTLLALSAILLPQKS